MVLHPVGASMSFHCGMSMMSWSQVSNATIVVLSKTGVVTCQIRGKLANPAARITSNLISASNSAHHKIILGLLPSTSTHLTTCLTISTTSRLNNATGATAKMAENIYDEIEIEDMTYDATLEIYHYPCPCGDRFEIGLADLRDGEDIGVCPSCSLMIKVIFEVVSLFSCLRKRGLREGVGSSRLIVWRRMICRNHHRRRRRLRSRLPLSLFEE